MVSGNLEKTQDFPRIHVEEEQTVDALELRHEAQVMKWQEKIVACRSSGVAVSKWCREQGISAKTYYRWEREVLAKAGQQLAVREQGGSPAFVEVRAAGGGEPAAGMRERVAVARLHTAAGEVEVYRGADLETLQAIIGALKSC